MNSGIVFDVKRFALHDGGGIRTTAFLKGCPLSCPWCQNPEGIDRAIRLEWTATKCIRCAACVQSCPKDALSQVAPRSGIAIDSVACNLCGLCVEECPTGALGFVGRRVSASDLAAELLRDRDFFEPDGGVTLSGGEPLAQPDFAAEVLQACRREGVHTAVETSLAVGWNAIAAVLPHTSLFIADLKLADPEAHRHVVGGDLAGIRVNIERLVATGAHVLVRVPMIPGFTTAEENLVGLGAYVSSLRPEPHVELINYNPLAESKYRVSKREWPIARDVPRFTAGEMESLSAHVRAGGAADVFY